MSNELLTAPARVKTLVPLTSRPGVEVYILHLSAFEFLEMGSKFKGGAGPGFNLGVELESALCNAAGELLLKDGEGTAFLKTISAPDMNALRAVMDRANSFSDKALEETAKN